MRNTPGSDRGRWAALVQSAREAARLTKTELARRLEVDRGTLHRWEMGTYRPDDPEVVKRFAELFRLDLEETLTAAGLRPATTPRIEPAQLALDPALAEAQAMLDDPSVSAATKAQVHAMLAAMVELVRSQPRMPRRRAG